MSRRLPPCRPSVPSGALPPHKIRPLPRRHHLHRIVHPGAQASRRRALCVLCNACWGGCWRLRGGPQLGWTVGRLALLCDFVAVCLGEWECRCSVSTSDLFTHICLPKLPSPDPHTQHTRTTHTHNTQHTQHRSYIKSEAVRRIGARLGLPFPLLAALAAPVPLALRDFLYEQVRKAAASRGCDSGSGCLLRWTQFGLALCLSMQRSLTTTAATSSPNRNQPPHPPVSSLAPIPPATPSRSRRIATASLAGRPSAGWATRRHLRRGSLRTDGLMRRAETLRERVGRSVGRSICRLVDL